MTDRQNRCSKSLLQCAVQKHSAGVNSATVCRNYGLSICELAARLTRFGAMPILDVDLLERFEKEQQNQQRKQK